MYHDDDDDDKSVSDDDEDASDTSEPSRFVTTALVSSSVVTHAVRGRFRAPDEVAVVLGKRDQLLMLAPDEERGGALRLERQQSARGTLVALKVARGGYGESDADAHERDDTRARDWFRADVDSLVALSDSGELSLLRYDKETRRFARFRSARLGPPGLRRLAPGVAARGGAPRAAAAGARRRAETRRAREADETRRAETRRRAREAEIRRRGARGREEEEAAVSYLRKAS